MKSDKNDKPGPMPAPGQPAQASVVSVGQFMPARGSGFVSPQPAVPPSSVIEWAREEIRAEVLRFELHQPQEHRAQAFDGAPSSAAPTVIQSYTRGKDFKNPEDAHELVGAMFQRATEELQDAGILGGTLFQVKSYMDASSERARATKGLRVMPQVAASAQAGGPANPEAALRMTMHHLEEIAALTNMRELEMMGSRHTHGAEMVEGWREVKKAFAGLNDKAIESCDRIVARYEKLLEQGGRQVERLERENGELHQQLLTYRVLSEEIYTKKHERDLDRMRAEHGERRKDAAFEVVAARVAPALLAKLASFLGVTNMGGGASSAPAAGPAARAREELSPAQYAALQALIVYANDHIEELAKMRSAAAPELRDVLDRVLASFMGAAEDGHATNGAVNGAAHAGAASAEATT
jgi:hypothetical protein